MWFIALIGIWRIVDLGKQKRTADWNNVPSVSVTMWTSISTVKTRVRGWVKAVIYPHWVPKTSFVNMNYIQGVEWSTRLNCGWRQNLISHYQGLAPHPPSDAPPFWVCPHRSSSREHWGDSDPFDRVAMDFVGPFLRWLEAAGNSWLLSRLPRL